MTSLSSLASVSMCSGIWLLHSVWRAGDEEQCSDHYEELMSVAWAFDVCKLWILWNASSTLCILCVNLQTARLINAASDHTLQQYLPPCLPFVPRELHWKMRPLSLIWKIKDLALHWCLVPAMCILLVWCAIPVMSNYCIRAAVKKVSWTKTSVLW